MIPLNLELAHALPEAILAVGAIVLLLIGAFRGKPSDGPMSELAIGVLGLALIVILLSHNWPDGVVFDNAFIDDTFGDYMKILALVGSIVTLLMAGDFFRHAGVDKFEFPILIVLATLGMLMLISANGLIALYLGLELMSLSLYVVAALSRDDARASEAGLKYFVLGALSSGMLLYGASLLYGFAGTVSFPGIAAAIGDHPSMGVIFGMVFLFAGLAFKMSVVPFHMWTPDVYEGAPTPVTTFFASAPKMAAVAVATRVVMTALPGARGPVAAGDRVHGAGLDGARLIRRHWPDQYQASDGLFRDRPHGLRAGRPRRRHRSRRARRRHLHGDLSGDDARRFRGHPVDAGQRQGGGKHLRSRRPVQDQRTDGLLPRHADVLAGRRAAAGGLFRQVLRVHGGGRRPPLLAGGDRHPDQRGGAPSIICASSRSSISTKPRRPSTGLTFTQRAVLALASLAMLLFWVYPAPLVEARVRCGQVAVLIGVFRRARDLGRL